MPSSRPRAPKTEHVPAAGPGTRTLTPDRWQRLKEALGAALDLDGQERRDFLVALEARDAPLAGDVRELLASPMTTAGALGAPAQMPFTLSSEPEAEEPSLVGRQVGPYRLVAEIGRGGMGAVYRGVRDEDGKQVAVKFVRGGADSAQVLRRFEAERRILAGLEHEHIASLIDGGRTEEGWPYFTLDYVEGLPITLFCEKQALQVPARLEIFRKVCAAVHYAHQRLVVHRDLKPGNILVTADGSPKLLDFGIAKLLRGAGDPSDAPTMTLATAMTPQYASPEQVRGESITTATDVYALGLLLYELLSGRQAQQLQKLAPDELVRAICETDPRPPSTLAAGPQRKQLSGDLDAIVMKALRKEPARRYASVQELSEDVRRQLEGRPVLAHGGAWSYRAGKFLRRHRGAALGAGLVLAVLIGGVISTLRQARLAEEQRALAQARFDDVRQLADSFLFEFHDAIRDLPGATPARKLVVSKALEYLDRLKSQAAQDLSLIADLSRAYQRVGDVQGSPFGPNLGDTAGAKTSYEKAVDLAEQLVAAEPRRAEWRLNLARALQRQGAMEFGLGEPEKALATQARSGQLFEELLKAAPEDRDLLHDLHISHLRRGDVHRDRRAWPAARVEFERCLALAEQARRLDPQDRRAARDASVALSRIADAQAATDPAAALETARRMLVLDEATAALDPEKAEAQRDVAIDHEDIGQRLSALARPQEALESHARALALRERLLAADPQNQQALQDVSVSHALIGETLAGLPGRQRDALASYRRALEIDLEILKRTPQSQRSHDYAGSSHANVAGMLLALGDAAAALEQFKSALGHLEPLAKGDPKDLGMRCFVADLLRQRGDAHVALARRGTDAGEHWRAAQADFSASQAEWERLRTLGADPAELKKAAGLAERLAACRAALGPG